MNVTSCAFQVGTKLWTRLRSSSRPLVLLQVSSHEAELCASVMTLQVCQRSSHITLGVCSVSAEVTLHRVLLPYSKLKCLPGTVTGWNGSGFSRDSHGVKWLWLFLGQPQGEMALAFPGTAMGWNGSGFSGDSHRVKWLWLFRGQPWGEMALAFPGTAMGWNGSGFSGDSHGVKWLCFYTCNTWRWWSKLTLSHEDHSETAQKHSRNPLI